MPRIADQPLVGRAAELEVVDLVLGELRRGTSAALLIQGEPGIGKTRLLAALAGRADADGCTVLEGGASELESDLPFWVFVDALDDYVAGLDPGLVSRLSDDARAELAHVLPSLSDLGAAAGPVLQDERYRVHRAMRELLERLAVRQPLVLVLDDVHWADPASVDLLAALLRSPPARVGADRAGRAAAPARRAPARRAGSSGPSGGARRASSSAASRAPRSPSCSATASATRGPIALRGDRREPLLPPAARAQRRRGRRRPLAEPGSGRRARGGDLIAERGARAAGRGDAPGARGRRGGRRSVRSRRRRRRRGRGRGRRPGGVRRAAGARAHRLHRGAAPLPVPAPARAPRGLRERAGRLAAGRPRARGDGARRARRAGHGAGAPCGVRRPAGRSGGDRRADRGRDGGAAARPGQRRPLVQRGAAHPARRRAGRATGRACSFARARARRAGPARREPRRSGGEHRAGAEAACACSCVRPAPASSACSAATTRRTRGCWRAWTRCPTRRPPTRSR